jgi:hypothetical protein
MPILQGRTDRLLAVGRRNEQQEPACGQTRIPIPAMNSYGATNGA